MDKAWVISGKEGVMLSDSNRSSEEAGQVENSKWLEGISEQEFEKRR